MYVNTTVFFTNCVVIGYIFDRLKETMYKTHVKPAVTSGEAILK